MVTADKTQNLRRLEAQRNELNSKGSYEYTTYTSNTFNTSFFNLILNNLLYSWVYSMQFQLFNVLQVKLYLNNL